MTTPYTYLIGWSKLNVWYYGVRYSEGCDPLDLWNPYKTSSKHVKAFIKNHGDPDVIKVRKTFNDHTTARKWEGKVLKKMGVVLRDDFLNKTDSDGFSPLPGKHNGMYGKTHSVEARMKIAEAAKGNRRTRGLTNEIREANGWKPITGKPKGTKHSDEAKQRRSESMKGIARPGLVRPKGIPHSAEAREKMRQAALRRYAKTAG